MKKWSTRDAMDASLRQAVIDRLNRGDRLPSEWLPLLFPNQKRECELVYYGKEREEEIVAETMGVPLQPVNAFGKKSSSWHNMVIFGDNLQAMKALIEKKKRGELRNRDGSDGVRVVYIDPPFASKREFSGGKEEKAYQDKVVGAKFLEFLRKRLILLRELLSDDGNVFVHLDWKKGHYVKVIMDEVFGDNKFVNEIIWRYRRWPSKSKSFQKMHDTIYWYSLAPTNRRYWQQQYEGLSESSLKHWKGKKRVDRTTDAGTRYSELLDEESEGVLMSDVWEISQVTAPSKSEFTGYPTQKPEKLIERIIQATTRAGDIVLDAFAGSGTTSVVAEKMNRRWIAIDCGKLAVYTMQRRLLNLRTEIGNKGRKLAPKPFTTYNAGLYDFATLKDLPWLDWRFFALQLFGCRDERHTINGLELDGYLKGASVLVFNHHEQCGQLIDEDTVSTLHALIGRSVGERFFIIAPRAVFAFQQDYIDLDSVRYYALRIPYSMINEIHRRAFTALKQPFDERDVNETVDAVGFDFIQPPKVSWSVGVEAGKKPKLGWLSVDAFESRSRMRGQEMSDGFHSLSALMFDFDFNGTVFEMDEVLFSHELQSLGWRAQFELSRIGERMMVVFIDRFGNESREVVSRDKVMQ